MPSNITRETRSKSPHRIGGIRKRELMRLLKISKRNDSTTKNDRESEVLHEAKQVASTVVRHVSSSRGTRRSQSSRRRMSRSPSKASTRSNNEKPKKSEPDLDTFMKKDQRRRNRHASLSRSRRRSKSRQPGDHKDDKSSHRNQSRSRGSRSLSRAPSNRSLSSFILDDLAGQTVCEDEESKMSTDEINMAAAQCMAIRRSLSATRSVGGRSVQSKSTRHSRRSRSRSTTRSVRDIIYNDDASVGADSVMSSQMSVISNLEELNELDEAVESASRGRKQSGTRHSKRSSSRSSSRRPNMITRASSNASVMTNDSMSTNDILTELRSTTSGSASGRSRGKRSFRSNIESMTLQDVLEQSRDELKKAQDYRDGMSKTLPDPRKKIEKQKSSSKKDNESNSKTVSDAEHLFLNSLMSSFTDKDEQLSIAKSKGSAGKDYSEKSKTDESQYSGDSVGTKSTLPVSVDDTKTTATSQSRKLQEHISSHDKFSSISSDSRSHSEGLTALEKSCDEKDTNGEETSVRRPIEDTEIETLSNLKISSSADETEQENIFQNNNFNKKSPIHQSEDSDHESEGDLQRREKLDESFNKEGFDVNSSFNDTFDLWPESIESNLKSKEDNTDVERVDEKESLESYFNNKTRSKKPIGTEVDSHSKDAESFFTEAADSAKNSLPSQKNQESAGTDSSFTESFDPWQSDFGSNHKNVEKDNSIELDAVNKSQESFFSDTMNDTSWNSMDMSGDFTFNPFLDTSAAAEDDDVNETFMSRRSTEDVQNTTVLSYSRGESMEDFFGDFMTTSEKEEKKPQKSINADQKVSSDDAFSGSFFSGFKTVVSDEPKSGREKVDKESPRAVSDFVSKKTFPSNQSKNDETFFDDKARFVIDMAADLNNESFDTWDKADFDGGFDDGNFSFTKKDEAFPSDNNSSFDQWDGDGSDFEPFDFSGTGFEEPESMSKPGTKNRKSVVRWKDEFASSTSWNTFDHDKSFAPASRKNKPNRTKLSSCAEEEV